MSNGKNKVLLIGHLGAAPEMKTMESGNLMAKMRVVTNEPYTNSKGEHLEDTQWHYVVAWGKQAEKARDQFNKGTEVSIEGRLRHREYTTTDGQRKFITEIVVEELSLVKKEEMA